MASTQTLSEPLAVDPIVLPSRSRRRPYFIVAAVVAVGLAAYGALAWVSRGHETTDDAQVDADAVVVSARVGGSVLRVQVSDNQVVKKGDLLVEIDPAELSAKVDQAEAALSASRAQAESADAQVRIVEATSRGGLSAARARLSGSTVSVVSAEAQVDAAKAGLSRAQADASRADSDLVRGESLRKDEAIPQAQLDSYRTSALSAHAQVAQAQAQLAAMLDAKRAAQSQIAEAQGRVEQSAPVDAQLGAAQANADLAHANVKAAQASLALARLELSYTHIEAPSDGHLSRLAVHDGQLVQAGQQVVALVPNTTYVLANFKETQVGPMRPGQRAEISVDAFPGRTFEGRVESTSPGTGARFSLLPADNASGNFVKVVQRVPVKITWVDVPPEIDLAAGLSADVTVHTR
jgi:membrane fusion protein (multidrug efflux system)